MVKAIFRATTAIAAVALAFATSGHAGPPVKRAARDDRTAPVALAVAQRRAAALVARMTLDEKIQLVTGQAGIQYFPNMPLPSPRSRGGDGFVPGIPRLGIPDIQISGSGLGISDVMQKQTWKTTALPSTLALASSFDRDMAYDYGALLGAEARAHGFNAFIGGGMNLTRDPRGGRAFEYHGEDPLLAGKLMAATTHGTQDQGVPATVKHYALNDIDNGRYGIDVHIDERGMREAELLAFEIAVKEGQPAIVMCSYNLVNTVYACENPDLLNDILKRQWGFTGWVMSDWGAVHSTAPSANAGLDQEFFAQQFFGKQLKAAVEAGKVPAARVDDMVRRIVTQLIRFGVLGRDDATSPIDIAKGRDLSRHVAEVGSVLLKNDDAVLPLAAGHVRSIAVIGYNADKGVVSGGGSSQVNPVGGNALPRPANVPFSKTPGGYGASLWDPSPPLAAIRAKAGAAKVTYDPGTDPARAADAARGADVAIVFAGRFRQEGADVPDLSLGDGQDAMIAAVSAANPRTIVVLETGGAVVMPWLGSVKGVLETWYPGEAGGEAIADLLFGDANPSGKLPLTFPATMADLPRVEHPGPPLSKKSGLIDFFKPIRSETHYDEGALVGYKWYDARDKTPLFPFGYGLSYTSFGYKTLTADLGQRPSVRFTLTNTGARAGTEIAQVYVATPDSPIPRRLAGWARAQLMPGQSQQVTVMLEPKTMANWDPQTKRWVMPRGDYTVSVGGSSRDARLSTKVRLSASRTFGF